MGLIYKYGSLYLRELLSRQLSQRFGVVSFATDPRHPLMWSRYANEGAGFVLGYSQEQLMSLTRKAQRLRKVQYKSTPIWIGDYRVLNEENIASLLSVKGEHWRYENERHPIVELDETIGMGRKGQHGQPINLVRVPNEAVMSVYYTERTPDDKVEEVQSRVRDPNNRYTAAGLTKLVMSATSYGYEDADGIGTVYVDGVDWSLDRYDRRDMLVEEDTPMEDDRGRSPSEQVNEGVAPLQKFLSDRSQPSQIDTAVILTHERTLIGEVSSPTVDNIVTLNDPYIDDLFTHPKQQLSRASADSVVKHVKQDHQFQERKRKRRKRTRRRSR